MAGIKRRVSGELGGEAPATSALIQMKILRNAWRELRTKTRVLTGNLIALGILFAFGCQQSGMAAEPASGRYRSDRILVFPKASSGPEKLAKQHVTSGVTVMHEFPHLNHLQLLRLPANSSVADTIQAYRESGLVEYAEPDYLVRASLAPNDPSFANGTQWGLNNTGVNGGVAGMDISAADGWATRHDAANVVVAVIDSGVWYTHQDLAANMWVNPNVAAGSGISVYGTNVLAVNGDPKDDEGHGTHVAGILGGVGNNGLGITGVAWKTRIMALKFLDDKGNGAVSDAIRCIEYARGNGAHIINASWGSTDFSLSLHNAIAAARNDGIIFVAAAANDATNTDLYASYPAGFQLDNIIAVGAINRSGQVAAYSNYGAKTVHLMAPGSEVYSSWYSGNAQYATASGTSMAAPFVAGMMALLKAQYPAESHRQLIARLLNNVDPLSAATGKCSSGGMANLANALSAKTVPNISVTANAGPAPLTVTFTNTSSGAASGTWNFGDGSAISVATSPTHTFTTPGYYLVSLTIPNGSGGTISVTKEIAAIDTYERQAATYSWIDLPASSLVSLDTNGLSSAISLPFPFVYYGRTNQQIYASTHGMAGFIPGGMDLGDNSSLPSFQPPNGMLCPYWDRLTLTNTAGIYAGTVGTAPNRKFVISWVQAYATTAPLTFQAVLAEGSPDILYQYQQVSPSSSRGGGKRATVGLEDYTGTASTQYTYNGSPATLTNAQALRFSPKAAAYSPPTVAVSAPLDGTVYAAPGAFGLIADVFSSSSTITQVEFFANANSLAVVTNSPWSSAVTNVPAGTYLLTARVTDALGGASTSEGVTVTVDQPPQVSLTSPADKARISTGTPIVLQAEATDSDGTVASVQFFQDTGLLGTTTNQPFSLAIGHLVPGVYSFTAEAIDNYGISGASSPATITILPLPTISWLAPTSGMVLAAPASVALAVNATNPGVAVGQVEFLNGTNSLGIITNPPYALTLSNLTAGSYEITAQARDELGGTATSEAVSVMVHQPPTVSISSPTNLARVSATTPLTVQADILDVEDSLAGVEFYLDGSLLSLDLSGPYVHTLETLAPGEHTFLVRAVDIWGFSTESSPVVVTAVSPPSISLLAPTNSTVWAAPATLALEASATNSDATISQVEFFAGTNSLGAVTNPPYALTLANLAAGTYTFTAQAMNDLGDTNTSDTIQIVVEQPPVIAFLTPTNQARFSTDTPITLQVAASDSDGTITSIEFYSGTNRLNLASTNLSTFGLGNLPAGEYTFTARAIDNWGIATESSPVTIAIFAPPLVELTAPKNGSILAAPANMALEARVTNTGATVVQVEFFGAVPPGEKLSLGVATNAPYAIGVTNLSAGLYEFSAQVRDELGGLDESGAVMVTIDQPPTITWNSPTNGTRFSTGSTIPLRVEATDSDGTVTAVAFYADELPLGVVTNNPYTLTWPASETGAHTLTARATDNHGIETTSSPVFISVVAPPSVGVSSPTNGTLVAAPATLFLNASASSTGAVITQVEFFADSHSLGWVTNSPFVLGVTNLAAGSYQITAQATDDLGGLGQSAPVLLIVDQPPVISLISPTNFARFSIDSPIPLLAQASDSDGSVAEVSFYSGDTLLGRVTNSPFALTLPAQSAGQFNLTARVLDNWGLAATSSLVIITSVPLPQITLAAQTNAAAYVAPATVQFSAHASSPGTQIVLIEFLMGTNSWKSPFQNSATLMISDLSAGTYTITAQAMDDLGNTVVSTPITFVVQPAAPMQILSATRLAEGKFQIAASGVPSNSWVMVQISTNLLEWSTLTNQATTSTNLIFTDTEAGSTAIRYYRIAR